MTAKSDSKRGLEAKLRTTVEETKQAVLRAVSILGNRADAVPAPGRVTVQIYPGMSRRASVTSPVVAVTIRSSGEMVQVNAVVEQYRTRQQKLFFVIPLGPKMLVGKQPLITFLSALQQELQAIDDGQGSVRLVTAG